MYIRVTPVTAKATAVPNSTENPDTVINSLFNDEFIFTTVQKPHEPVIEISKSVRANILIGSFEKDSS